MTSDRKIELFSKERLSSYADDDEHIANFKLIKNISDKLGVIEIITRNKVAKTFNIKDDTFISRQTLGYWVELMDNEKIHNKIVDFGNIDFRDYSKGNKNNKLLNYQKVWFAYSLVRTIRNRAFHFENLYKLNENKTPRLSTKRGKTIIGIEPTKIECFLTIF